MKKRLQRGIPSTKLDFPELDGRGLLLETNRYIKATIKSPLLQRDSESTAVYRYRIRIYRLDARSTLDQVIICGAALEFRVLLANAIPASLMHKLWAYAGHETDLVLQVVDMEFFEICLLSLSQHVEGTRREYGIRGWKTRAELIDSCLDQDLPLRHHQVTDCLVTMDFLEELLLSELFRVKLLEDWQIDLPIRSCVTTAATCPRLFRSSKERKLSGMSSEVPLRRRWTMGTYWMPWRILLRGCSK